MKKKLLGLAMVVALVVALVVPMAALADNQGDQEASTTQATTITIVGKTATSVAVVSTITFPAGAPSAVISNPSSDAADAEGTPQFLDGTNSTPVVQLYNGSAGTLTIWLGITAWTDSAVASERYVLSDPGTTDTDQTAMTAGTALGASATTGEAITTLAWKALYLEVTLGALSGKSGTSTLTVLGETP